MAYGIFADFYDFFNEDADYDVLSEQVLAALREHGVSDGIVIDLGCGTGELTLRLAQAGYDMIGVDASEEMLSVLQEKEFELGMSGVLLLHQELQTLDLYGTVRAAVSTFDTFNHIGPVDEFERALCRASLFLEPGGVFVFDMNTPTSTAAFWRTIRLRWMRTMPCAYGRIIPPKRVPGSALKSQATAKRPMKAFLNTAIPKSRSNRRAARRISASK